MPPPRTGAAATASIRQPASTTSGGGGGGGVSSAKIAEDMAKCATQWQKGEISDDDYRTQISTLIDLRLQTIPEPDYNNEIREEILTAYVRGDSSGNSYFPKEIQDRVSDLDHKYPDMRLFAKNLIDKNGLTNSDTHRPYRLTEILEKYVGLNSAESSDSAVAPQRLEPFQNQSSHLLSLLTVAINSVTQQLDPIGGIDIAKAAVRSSDKGYEIINVINHLQPEPDSDLEKKRRECIKSAMILRAFSDKYGKENTQITKSTEEIMAVCEANNILEYYNTIKQKDLQRNQRT